MTQAELGDGGNAGLDADRARIRADLEARAEAGDKLLVADRVFSAIDPEDQRFQTWHEGNLLYVRNAFAGESAGLYFQIYAPPANLFRHPGYQVERHNAKVQEYTRRLRSMATHIEHLDLAGPALREPSTQAKTPSKRVFIVHGRDLDLAKAVAGFVQDSFGLEPVILQDMPNGGITTVIAKIEEYSDVGFAIVVMTPDDVGKLADSEDPAERRARQNVVFELGYFIGKLGWQGVCAIGPHGMKDFSDFAGVITLPIDLDRWQEGLTRELKLAIERGLLAGASDDSPGSG